MVWGNHTIGVLGLGVVVGLECLDNLGRDIGIAACVVFLGKSEALREMTCQADDSFWVCPNRSDSKFI